MVKVYSDLISGDEMVSDSYPHTMINEDTTMEVKARYVQKGSDNIQIAADDEIDEGDTETVVDVQDSFQLNEINLSKKEVMMWAKKYFSAVTDKLKESDPDRIPLFKKGATTTIKLILSKHDEMQIFTGRSINMDGSLAFAYQKEQEDEGPTFLFFVDGMKGQKFWARNNLILSNQIRFTTCVYQILLKAISSLAVNKLACKES